MQYSTEQKINDKREAILENKQTLRNELAKFKKKTQVILFLTPISFFVNISSVNNE